MDNTAQLFDDVARVIIKMGADIDKLAERYGRNSKFIQEKRKQIETLTFFFDSMAEKMTVYEASIARMDVTVRAQNLLLFQKENNLSARQLSALNGFKNSNKWELIDEIDKQLKNLDDKINGIPGAI